MTDFIITDTIVPETDTQNSVSIQLADMVAGESAVLRLADMFTGDHEPLSPEEDMQQFLQLVVPTGYEMTMGVTINITAIEKV